MDFITFSFFNVVYLSLKQLIIMKKIFFTLVLSIFCTTLLYSQSYKADSVNAENNLKKGIIYSENNLLDSADFFLSEASSYYEKRNIWNKYLYAEQKKAFCKLKVNDLKTADSIFTAAFLKANNKIESGDTVFVDTYKNYAYCLYNSANYDSAYVYAKKAYDFYEQTDFNNEKLKIILCNVYANIKYVRGEFDDAIALYEEGMELSEKLYGPDHIRIAQFCSNLGVILGEKREVDKAFKYYERALEILLNILGDRHPYIAITYNGMANVLIDKGEYDEAIELFNRAILITEGNTGEINNQSIDYYQNIAIATYHKHEYSLSLEYFNKILPALINFFGENSIKVADVYNNMGICYDGAEDFETSLKYKTKAYELYLDILGEKHVKTANALSNIATLLAKNEEYDKSIEYQLKVRDIFVELYGIEDYNTSKSDFNLAETYITLKEYELAKKHFETSLQTRIKLFGHKNPDVALVHMGLAELNNEQGMSKKALKYHQLSFMSNVKSFNDTVNLLSIPVIDHYFERDYLLETLYRKALLLSDLSISIDGFTKSQRLHAAYLHFLSADTLINKIRKEINSKHDKIELGKKAEKIYKASVELCLQMAENPTKGYSEGIMKEKAFYFSEKNRTAVLMEALAGSEAQKFAQIPDSLLNLEKQIQVNIEFYKKLIAESPDSIDEIKYRSRLFNLNRSYDSLIVVFENNFPKYHELKYSSKNVEIDQIRNLLDKNSALLSYFITDSLNIIFFISKKHFYVSKLPKNIYFSNYVANLRESISNTAVLRQEFNENSNESVEMYLKASQKLYEQLFPKDILKKLKKKGSSAIKNLVIVPDGELSKIPFEALLTNQYSAEWTNWNNTDYFSEMPYLIKDYNISYSYSTNLFYETFPKISEKPEFRNINDWLALAPVFDNDSISGTSVRTRQLIEKNSIDNSGQLNTRAWLRDGTYISPLPGSEEETKNIFKIFEENNKKAVLKTHKYANEEYIKSGVLKDFRFLHVATHGMVNEDKPELSCILLAQDTTSTEDNILFSGEIYNLELNADLTVLSACETGLGKIAEGEGVIGLTRALLYAGSKNIIVSLWQVSDESTNQLMVDFYKNIFEDEEKTFSEHLSKSKLKLINDGKYAHPFFWSPFVLIGK